MEEKKKSFGEFLIWATALMTGLLGLEGVVCHFVNDEWEFVVRVVFFFIQLTWLIIYQAIIYRQDEEKKKTDYVDFSLVGFAGFLNSLFSIFVFEPNHFGLPNVWFALPFLILFQAFALYWTDRSMRKSFEVGERQKREPGELLDRVSQSDQPVFIVISHVPKQHIAFELDDKATILYQLVDDRYLVLFRREVGMKQFLKVLSALRSETNDDEDVIGYYGRSCKGAQPDGQHAFVSNLRGECRTIPFDLTTVPFDEADPIPIRDENI